MYFVYFFIYSSFLYQLLIGCHSFSHFRLYNYFLSQILKKKIQFEEFHEVEITLRRIFFPINPDNRKSRLNLSSQIYFCGVSYRHSSMEKAAKTTCHPSILVFFNFLITLTQVYNICTCK